MKVPNVVYVMALGIWVAWAVLYPSWVGRIYHRADWPGASGVYAGGVFGLDRDRAPVWDPPRAHSHSTAAVRWPWQPARSGDWVEPDVGAVAWRVSAGVVVLGFLLAALHWVRPTVGSGLFGRVACAVSLSQFIGWVILFWVGAFTMGLGLEDEVIAIVLATATVMGIGYGVWSHRAVRAVQAAPGGPHPGAGLFRFVTGLLVTCGITVGVAWTANLFRGPVAGGNGFGGVEYVEDQTPVNIVAGAGIVALGWTLAGIARARRLSAGLVLGLAVGATLLGLAFALQF